MTALYGLSAAGPQRVIPARLKLWWNHPVRVAPAVPRIDIVAIAARRRMPVAPVLGLDEQGVVVARRKNRCALEGERDGGNAHEHVGLGIAKQLRARKFRCRAGNGTFRQRARDSQLREPAGRRKRSQGWYSAKFTARP